MCIVCLCWRNEKKGENLILTVSSSVICLLMAILEGAVMCIVVFHSKRRYFPFCNVFLPWLVTSDQ